MTIGYILDDSLDRSDGVQQAMIAIGEYMRELGHDVHYIVADTKRTDLKNIHSIGGYFSMKFNGNSVRTPKPVSKKVVKKLFQDVQFDVLHVQMPYSPFLAAKVLKYAPKNVRKVGTFHILPYNWFSSFGTRCLGIALKSTLKRLDVCYAVSEPAKVFMEEAFSVKGRVLPNPVDYHFYQEFKRRQSDKKRLVFVGRFEERKGVQELLSAYAALDASVLGTTELMMVGKGPLHDVIQKRAKYLGLDITFPGFVSEEQKAQYLADADIAVFPSTSGESFGIVLAEAMAAGSTITIGGDNPGYASVLAPWPKTLFNPKDTQAFTKKLSSLLTDSELVEEISKQQHEAVRQYDIIVVAERLLSEAYGQK